MWSMPDNINISTPISGNTNVSRPNQMPKEPLQVNVLNPSRVNPPNADKPSDQNADTGMLFSRNSVFGTFVSQLRQVPGLNQTLQKMMFELFVRKDGFQSEALPQTLKQLAMSAEMGKTDILQNLRFQSRNMTKFSGPLFDELRDLSRQNGDGELRIRLARFLKAYDQVFSAPETMKEIGGQLELLNSRLPKYYANRLQTLTEAMVDSQTPESIAHNLTVLKEKILPFLATYAATTKDTGEARNTINLLVHTMARMNAGSREELVQKFVDLSDYCRYHLHLPADRYLRLQGLFADKLKSGGEPEGNVFFDSLMKTLSDGFKQSVSDLGQSLYKDTCSALLLDNSVYMPFMHFFLPVSYEGRRMFTDLWIEKEPGGGRPTAPEEEKTVHVYLTFTVQGLGYFEMMMEIRKSRLSVSLNCPSLLRKDKSEIHQKLSAIFSENGLAVDKITLSDGDAPKVSEQILRKVYEWRDMIDVSV